MNTEKLVNYISNPQSLNKDSLEEIQKLVQLFPFSQNIQLLYLFNLSITQDIRFGDQLQKTATYASDRRLLKKQIEALKKPLVSAVEDVSVDDESSLAIDSVNDTVETAHVISAEIQADNTEIEQAEESSQELKLKPERRDNIEQSQASEDLLAKRDKVRSKAELLQKVKERLAEIEASKADRTYESLEDEIKTEEEAPIQNKMDLIDKFILVKPSISRPVKTAFFDPDVAAQESLFEDGEIVTETLARIYHDQGNYRKANEIYHILSLNNPEKSSYFAALIEELENKIN